jgi:hypothetical protein
MPRRRNINRGLDERRERKYRLRGRTHRFIPDKDSDFACMGRRFAIHVADHAERLGVPPGRVAELASAVAAFRDALCRSMQGDTAGPKATAVKNEARKHAEKTVRSAARFLRGTAEEKLNGFDRMELNMPERPKRVKRQKCPQVAPVLRFVGAVGPHGPVHAGNSLRHILEYGNDFDNFSSARPHGAARLELFVELVPVGDPIPSHPGERSGGRLWYLRSFTTSRFEVAFPVMVDESAGGGVVPMQVCYWGRWADSSGGVGPFSGTCVARVEGCTPQYALPGAQHEQIRVTQVIGQLEGKVMFVGQQALPGDSMSMETLRQLPGAGAQRNLLEAG